MRARPDPDTGDALRASKRGTAHPPCAAGIRRMPVNPYAAAYLHASQRSTATGSGDAPPVEMLRAAQARVFQNDTGAASL
jgi:hypothetical protein